jgi:hypothetical protein
MDSSSVKEEDEEVICGAGCLEVVDKLSAISLRECMHKFHFNCIMNWFQASKKTSCPLCRIDAHSFIKPSGELLPIRVEDELNLDDYESMDEVEEVQLGCLICYEIIEEEERTIECMACYGYAHTSCLRRGRMGSHDDWICRQCRVDHFEASMNETTVVHTARATNPTFPNANPRSSGIAASDPIRARIDAIRASSSSSSSSSSTTAADQTKLIEQEMVLARERMLHKSTRPSNSHPLAKLTVPTTNASPSTTASTSKKPKAHRSSFIDEMEESFGKSDGYGYRPSQPLSKRPRRSKPKTNQQRIATQLPSKYQNIIEKLRILVDRKAITDRAYIATLLSELALCLNKAYVQAMIHQGVLTLLGELLRPIRIPESSNVMLMDPAIRESVLRTIDCYLVHIPAPRYRDEMQALLRDYSFYPQRYPSIDHGRSCKLAVRVLERYQQQSTASSS